MLWNAEDFLLLFWSAITQNFLKHITIIGVENLKKGLQMTKLTPERLEEIRNYSCIECGGGYYIVELLAHIDALEGDLGIAVKGLKGGEDCCACNPVTEALEELKQRGTHGTE